MLGNLINEIKSAPERWGSVPQKLKSAPQRLKDRGDTLVKELKATAVDKVDDGAEMLWNLQNTTLKTVDELLERAVDVPGVGKVAKSAEQIVQQGLEALNSLPVEDYETLNVKQVLKALTGLTRVDLLKVEKFELANKNRKTVLKAITAKL
jgi:hypothetical protein